MVLRSPTTPRFFQKEHPYVRYLSKPENQSQLREMTTHASSRFVQLRELKAAGKLDFGRKILANHLNPIASQVMQAAAKALETPAIELKKIQIQPLTTTQIKWVRNGLAGASIAAGLAGSAYFMVKGEKELATASMASALVLSTGAALYAMPYMMSYWNPRTETLHMEQLERAAFIPRFAHEYTHAIQAHLDAESAATPPTDMASYMDQAALKEGQARFVERQIAHQFADTEDNPAFLYHLYWVLSYNLAIAHIAIQSQEHKPLDPDLEKLIQKCGKKCSQLLKRQREVVLTHHAIGDAMLGIAEKKHGPKVYLDVLKNLDFLNAP